MSKANVIALAISLSLIGVSHAQADWCINRKALLGVPILTEPAAKGVKIGQIDNPNDIVWFDGRKNSLGYWYHIRISDPRQPHRAGWVKAEYFTAVYDCGVRSFGRRSR